MDDNLLVAAIDFGTTFSGYAFSFRDEHAKDPLSVHVNQTWTAGSMSLLSLKTPTCLLLDKSKKFVAFGFAAEDKYLSLSSDDEHHDYYFFRRFKMLLHNNKTLSRETTIEDDKGKTLLAMKVFSMSIAFLKGHLLETLETRGTGIHNKDIVWVLTVPAIWSDSAKQFMREAAKDAGIEGKQLKIALEPEAASLYCQLIPTEKMVDAAGTRFAASVLGTKYMVIDLGGGTADITVHMKQSDGTLKELCKPSGGDYGGTKVDEAFDMLLIKMVGAKIFRKFGTKHKDDSLDLHRELETKKRTITTESKEKITIKIPVSLKTLFEEETGEKMSEMIKQTIYAKSITWVSDKMRMEPEVLLGLFEYCISNIISHVKTIMEEVSEISTILLVGGFSDCQPIQNAVRKAFPKSKLIIPADAGLVVLKGAVIFGHNPQQITCRVSKYTYGINISPPFNEGVHPEQKKVMIDGKPRCRDVFKKYVASGEPIKIGEFVVGNHVTIKKNQREMLLKVFGTPAKNPKFVTDDDTQLLGRICVALPEADEKQKVEVKMVFGETELMVTAAEQKSKSKFQCSFDFL